LARRAYGLGRAAEADQWSRKAADAVLAAGVDERTGDSLTDAAWIQAALEQHTSALDLFASGLAARPEPYVEARQQAGRAYVLQFMGRIDEANTAALASLAAATASGSVHAQVMALSMRCLVAVHRGDPGAALAFGRSAFALSRAERSQWTAVAGCLLGQAHLLNGDPRRCVRMMTAAGGGRELPDVDRLHRPFFFEALSAASLLIHDAESCRRWADLAEESAAHTGLRLREGTAQLTRSFALLASGDVAQAVAQSRFAAQTFTLAGDSLRTGRAHLVTGIALTGADPRGAVADLDQAKRLFALVGATGPYLKADREQQRAVALGGQDGWHSALAGLTERELKICELLAQGSTNREIAGLLFVSAKTVEASMTRIFAKLGVTSRVAAAALISSSLRDR
ncbi:helix-turn-helix transcriptional regulator, partial [Actinocorallia lasiicapitis]